MMIKHLNKQIINVSLTFSCICLKKLGFVVDCLMTQSVLLRSCDLLWL